MPQMAPIMWVYLLLVMFILLVWMNNYVYFMKQSQNNFGKKSINMKNLNWTW